MTSSLECCNLSLTTTKLQLLQDEWNLDYIASLCIICSTISLLKVC